MTKPMPVIFALFLALTSALALAIPALIAELGKAPADVPLFIDVRSFWGHRFNKREVFWIGLFIHFLMAALFGVLYELLALTGYVRPFFLGNMIAYATSFYILVGVVIFPLVGLGFFGRKEGNWAWFELLIVHHFLAVFMWVLVNVFPVLRP